MGGRNGQVALSLTPGDPLFPTFPNTLPAFPPGAVLPARDIQEISPDLENEYAWAGNRRIPAPDRPARPASRSTPTSTAAVKHGFLDVNQAAPIDKDGAERRDGRGADDHGTAPQRRPMRPGRSAGAERLPAHGRADERRALLVSGRPHRGAAPDRRRSTLTASYTLSKAEDRLNHWFSPEDSSDPELDRGRTGADTPHNFVASATWNMPGSGPVLSGWRLSGVLALAKRHARIRSATRATRPGTALTQLQQPRLPGDPARGRATPSAARSSTTRTSRCREPSPIGERPASSSAPTCSTCSTTRT